MSIDRDDLSDSLESVGKTQSVHRRNAGGRLPAVIYVRTVFIYRYAGDVVADDTVISGDLYL